MFFIKYKNKTKNNPYKFSNPEKLLKENGISGANVFVQIAAEGRRLENRISSQDTTSPNKPFAAPATQITAQQPTNMPHSPTLAERQAHVSLPSASPIDTILIGLNAIQDTHLRDPSLEGLVMSGSYTIEDMQKCVNAIQTSGIKERCQKFVSLMAGMYAISDDAIRDQTLLTLANSGVHGSEASRALANAIKNPATKALFVG